MGCGCQGAKWTPPTDQQVQDTQATTAQAPTQPVERSRELIPGGYWNGPQAKK